MKLKVFTDGGARGNPGIAGIGVFITDANGKEIEKRYKNIGIATNNFSEYTGAFLGIKRAIEIGATEIDLFMDSQLVIKQLSGEWKIKDENLKNIYLDIKKLISESSVQVNFFHIERKLNKEADRLSNLAMDQKN